MKGQQVKCSMKRSTGVFLRRRKGGHVVATSGGAACHGEEDERSDKPCENHILMGHQEETDLTVQFRSSSENMTNAWGKGDNRLPSRGKNDGC